MERTLLRGKGQLDISLLKDLISTLPAMDRINKLIGKI